MDKLVKKKFTYTEVTGLVYSPEDKTMVLYENTFPGRLSLERAQTRARRVERDNTIVIQNVEYIVRVMAITVDTFLDYAEEI